MAAYWEIATHSAYNMFSEYKYLIVNLVFPHLGFWSGNFFLIDPYSDRCLLLLFCIIPLSRLLCMIRELKNMYVSFVASPLMKYSFLHFTHEISHIQQKHLNILFIFWGKWMRKNTDDTEIYKFLLFYMTKMVLLILN